MLDIRYPNDLAESAAPAPQQAYKEVHDDRIPAPTVILTCGACAIIRIASSVACQHQTLAILLLGGYFCRSA